MARRAARTNNDLIPNLKTEVELFLRLETRRQAVVLDATAVRRLIDTLKGEDDQIVICTITYADGSAGVFNDAESIANLDNGSHATNVDIEFNSNTNSKKQYCSPHKSARVTFSCSAIITNIKLSFTGPAAWVDQTLTTTEKRIKELRPAYAAIAEINISKLYMWTTTTLAVISVLVLFLMIKIKALDANLDKNLPWWPMAGMLVGQVAFLALITSVQSQLFPLTVITINNSGIKRARSLEWWRNSVLGAAFISLLCSALFWIVTQQ